MDQPPAYVRGSGDVKSSPKQANRSIQTALFVLNPDMLCGSAVYRNDVGLLFPVMIYRVLCYEL